MSIAAMNWAFRVPCKLSHKADHVLTCLADYADDRNQCWPSYETLATKSKYSRSSVHMAIKELEEQGLITITRRYEDHKRTSNLYTLNVETISETPELSPELSPKLSPKLSPRVCTVTTNRTVSKNHKEKGREARKAKEVEIEFPKPLDTPSFKEQWIAYEEYRRENKFRRMGPTTIKTKLAELSEWGEEVAIAQIRQSIGNGWQGIFPPKSFSSKPRAAGAPEAKEGSAPRRRTWEIRQVLDSVEDRLSELRRHRGEVSCGEYIWDSEPAEKEYYEKLAHRKQLKKEMQSAC